MIRKLSSALCLLTSDLCPLTSVLCLLSCVLCLLSSDLHAASLTIETQTTVSVTTDMLKVVVTYTNKGNAPAQNLQAHLIFSEEKLHGTIKPHLEPGQSDKAEFEKSLSGLKKGRHPLTVVVDFHDTNQYPFSAVSGMTYHYLEDVNADLLAVSKGLIIEMEGSLGFAIKNLGDAKKSVRASLMLPREFSTSRTKIDFEMNPRSEKELIYDIDNFSAIEGASYPVFCFLEYDSGDVHHTQVSRALIKVSKKENWFRRYRTTFVSLTGLLLAAFIVLMIRHRRSSPSSWK